MKRYIYILLIASLSVGTFSCSLDISQREKLGSGDISSVKDIDGLALSIYAKARPAFMGEQLMWFDYMSDILNETSNSGNRGGFFYRWTLISSHADVMTIWTDIYSAISHANFLLSKVDEVMANNTGAEDTELLKQYKGEAYLWRAILHRQLALRYCKDYEPATAASDRGIPIMDSYSLYAKPSRGTLEDTYAQIIEDITDAEALINKNGSANATRFTVDAVSAFKVQVYLDMHNYSEAITEVNTLISKYPLATSKEDVQSIWGKDQSSETIFQLGLTTSEFTNASSDLYYYDYNGGNFIEGEYISNGAYIPEQWVVDLYDQAKDWRYGSYIGKGKIDFSSTISEAYLINKYLGAENLRTSSNYNWYNAAKLFRMADMVLIKAEAEYMNNSGDPLATLNSLRTARGLDNLPGSVDGEDLFEEIQKERTREMICEGGRIPDIKRWKISPKRNYQPDMVSNLQAGTTHDKILEYNANAILMPIPLSEFSVNTNLKGQQNPGYNE